MLSGLRLCSLYGYVCWLTSLGTFGYCCGGDRVTFTELDVDVEIGMKQGQEIPYHGEGEPHIDGTSIAPSTCLPLHSPANACIELTVVVISAGEPGSLVLRVNVLKHPVFTRR
jgi:DnaJ-class molecular chaperone